MGHRPTLDARFFSADTRVLGSGCLAESLPLGSGVASLWTGRASPSRKSSMVWRFGPKLRGQQLRGPTKTVWRGGKDSTRGCKNSTRRAREPRVSRMARKGKKRFATTPTSGSLPSFLRAAARGRAASFALPVFRYALSFFFPFRSTVSFCSGSSRRLSALRYPSSTPSPLPSPSEPPFRRSSSADRSAPVP